MNDILEIVSLNKRKIIEVYWYFILKIYFNFVYNLY